MTQLKSKFDDFFTRLESLNEQSLNSFEVREEIFNEYKNLYELFETIHIQDESFSGVFTSDDLKRIHCLSLGLENNNDLYKLIDYCKLPNHIFMLANFLKSSDGYKIANCNSGFEKFSDEELIYLFNGIFGVVMSKDCVKSLRAEKIGSIVGYALSGLALLDIKKYEELPATIKARKGLGEFLKEQIQRSDIETSFFESESADDGHIYFTASINGERNRLNSGSKTRSAQKIDHTFINKQEKKIIIGMSTANNNGESQKDSYVKAYTAMKLLVGEKFLRDENGNLKENEYFGYSIEPYYFLTGRFDANETDKNQKSSSGSKFLSSIDGLSVDEKTVLGQLQYLSLILGSFWMSTSSTLVEMNPFIAGCDTLSFYNWQSSVKYEANKQDEGKKEDFYTKELFKKVYSMLKKSVDSINKTSAFENYSELLDLSLNNIHSIAKKMRRDLLRVKLTDNELNDLYKNFVYPLNESFIELSEKIEREKKYFSKLIVHYESIRLASRMLENRENFLNDIDIFQKNKEPDIKWRSEFDRRRLCNDKVGKFTFLLNDGKLQSFHKKSKEIFADTIWCMLESGFEKDNSDEWSWNNVFPEKEFNQLKRMMKKYLSILDGESDFDEHFSSKQSFTNSFKIFNEKIRKYDANLAKYLQENIKFVLPCLMHEQNLIDVSKELVSGEYSSYWVPNEDHSNRKLELKILINEYENVKFGNKNNPSFNL